MEASSSPRTPLPHPTPRATLEARLFLGLAFLQLGLHVAQCLSARDPRLWPPHAVAYVGDLLLLGLVRGLAALLRRLASPRRVPGLTGLTLAGLVTLGASLSLYPQTLREYLAFPVNLFAAGGDSTRVLLTEYLGISRLWPAGLAIVVSLLALKLPIPLPHWPRARALFWVLLSLLGLATAPRPPHPVFYSLKTVLQARLTAQPRQFPPLQRPPRRTLPIPRTSPSLPSLAGPLRADHLLLVVLEGVTARDFELEFLSKNNGFYARVKDRATWFSGYRATNLDSYTSLIALLTGVQVPYRAYADEGLYAAVNQASSLPRLLRSLGYFSLFSSTYAYQPFVPARDAWHQVLDRSHLPSLEGFLSLGSSRMEAATEDLAALPTLLATLARHPRTFILPELVYGHSSAWRARTGIPPLAYYDRYLLRLLEGLEARGLTRRTLLVVVSDHGDRAKSALAENYRVPLLVVAPQGPGGVDTAFRTHLDLPLILATYLTGSPLPPPRDESWLIGSTERWIYGMLKANGDHLFLDDASGRILSQKGSLEAPQVQRRFQASLNAFAAQYGP